MKNEQLIQIGQVYRHYKGNLYKVIGFAVHTETEERLVIYDRADTTPTTPWARPESMWSDMVMIDSNENIKARRFTLVTLSEVGNRKEVK